MGENLLTINDMINTKCMECTIDGKAETIKPEVYVVVDVSALRHSEHLANSGWCGCTRDYALRTTPPKPETVSEMYTLLERCVSHSREDRFMLAHMTVPNEEKPRPCPRCAFAHDPATASKELETLLATEAQLKAVPTKAGKAKFSKWRMDHAKAHLNVQPGEYGKPFIHHHLDNQILDPLHYSQLGAPKTPWKHGILNNASDDAREQISDQLKWWRHPLDTRRKDDNRVRAQKWFTGEKWHTFCAGERGSPGGPIAIATLVLVIANDMQSRGVTDREGTVSPSTAIVAPVVAAVTAVAAPAPAPTKAAGRGRGALLQRLAPPPPPPQALVPTEPPVYMAQRAEVQYIPSALEREADPEDLKIIRDLFGSRAQTIINALLAFDAYFNWYYALKKSVGLFCEKSKREERALDNCRKAIDMHEMFERCSICSHGSYLMHGAIFKVTRDILRVGDVWAFSLSSLELQNAETKRVATSGGSRHLTMSTEGQTRRAPRGATETGPISKTKGYGTTQAISTLRKLLGAQMLRRGGGVVALPDSRRKERLMAGRTKILATGVKLELVDKDYSPCHDTCLKAFVRLLAAQNASAES